MKRTPLARKSPLKAKKPLKRSNTKARTEKPAKRQKKPSVRLLKKKLWKLCREIAFEIYAHECYTCGTYLQRGSSIMQLGHFLPKSTCSAELAFDMKNLRWQCRYCNQFKSGEWVKFEQRLIAEHGQEYVDELKRRDLATRGKQYDTLWYQNKIAEYSIM